MDDDGGAVHVRGVGGVQLLQLQALQSLMARAEQTGHVRVGDRDGGRLFELGLRKRLVIDRMLHAHLVRVRARARVRARV